MTIIQQYEGHYEVSGFNYPYDSTRNTREFVCYPLSISISVSKSLFPDEDSVWFWHFITDHIQRTETTYSIV